jgi:hypothetical protein
MAINDTRAANGRRDFLKFAGGYAAAAAVGCAGETSSAPPATATKQTAGARDRGLWITWYDLPDQGRDQYLSWLHATYLPDVLKRPGYLWAAHYRANERTDSPNIHHTTDPIGTGYHYILLIGAEDTHVFGDPTPTEINAALPEEGRKMVALRMGERVNIAVEAGRIDGSALAGYRDGLMSAPAIQIGSFNCELGAEEELHAGYVRSRLPAMAKTPTNVRNRNLKSVVGWAKHIILYEFTTPELFARDYEGAGKAGPLGIGGNSVVPKLTHAPNGPNSAVRIWPGAAATS